MKFPSQTLCFVLAGAALVLAGCSKKPTRPDPSATVLGPNGGGSGSINPEQIATTVPTTDLAARDEFDPNGQNRTALQAQTVYFDFDRFEVKASERPKLQAVKEYLDKNPGQRVLFEGHCDWRGTAEYNLALGDRRANAVKKYLVSLGVPADRVETLSKGSLEAGKNADEATMAKDRRADVVALRAGTSGTIPTGSVTPAGAPAGAMPPPASGGL